MLDFRRRIASETTRSASSPVLPVTSAQPQQCREQLESHLQEFRRIAEQRHAEKVTRWGYHLPALLSAIIILCQLANTVIFASFAYNFGELYVLLDEYMLATDNMTSTLSSSSNDTNTTTNTTITLGSTNDTTMDTTSQLLQAADNSTQLTNATTTVFRYEGVNAQRITEIDNYHDQLWTLFVAEVIELIFPSINIVMFGWIMQDKHKRLPSRLLVIYLLCPALALMLSISQACMIHVTLTEQIYTIRFLIAKLLSILLEVNRPGRLPLEEFFECEFYNDDDIVKPPCAGQLHDTVVSKSSLTVLMVIHILPVFAFVYLLVKNLSSNKSEHLFLYIESVEQGKPYHAPPILMDEHEPHSLRGTIEEMLNGFNTKFLSKNIFHERLAKLRRSRSRRLSMRMAAAARLHHHTPAPPYCSDTSSSTSSNPSSIPAVAAAGNFTPEHTSSKVTFSQQEEEDNASVESRVEDRESQHEAFDMKILGRQQELEIEARDPDSQSYYRLHMKEIHAAVVESSSQGVPKS